MLQVLNEVCQSSCLADTSISNQFREIIIFLFLYIHLLLSTLVANNILKCEAILAIY